MPGGSLSFDFPIDILCYIIEFAVWNDYKTAQNLELVNRTFRTCTGPSFYKTVLLHSPSSLIGFSELIRTAPAPGLEYATAITRNTDFYAKSVRYLSIHKPRVPEYIFEPIFFVCTGVVTLELEGVWLGQEPLAMRPKQYIQPSSSMSSIPLSTFENVTHLWSNVPFHPINSMLPAQLKCVGLLLLSSDFDKDYLWLERVQNLPSLRLFILTVQPSHYGLYRQSNLYLSSPRILWERASPVLRDERIVLRFKNDVFQESEVQMARRLGMSVWELALLDGARHPDFELLQFTDLEFL